MHKVEFIHIICTDPRIQKIYHNYLVENNLFGNYDTIQYENPILDFLDDGKRGKMLERIKAYRELHGANKIVLLDHFDCGAYKLNGYNFSDKDSECQTHIENNKKAVEIIKDGFPYIEVDIKYIDIKDDGSCEWRSE